MQDEKIDHAHPKSDISSCDDEIIWCTIAYLRQCNRAKVNCIDELVKVLYQSLSVFDFNLCVFKEVLDLGEATDTDPQRRRHDDEDDRHKDRVQ